MLLVANGDANSLGCCPIRTVTGESGAHVATAVIAATRCNSCASVATCNSDKLRLDRGESEKFSIFTSKLKIIDLN